LTFELIDKKFAEFSKEARDFITRKKTQLPSVMESYAQNPEGAVRRIAAELHDWLISELNTLETHCKQMETGAFTIYDKATNKMSSLKVPTQVKEPWLKELRAEQNVLQTDMTKLNALMKSVEEKL
jgi:hypothetical protein